MKIDDLYIVQTSNNRGSIGDETVVYLSREAAEDQANKFNALNHNGRADYLAANLWLEIWEYGNELATEAMRDG